MLQTSNLEASGIDKIVPHSFILIKSGTYQKQMLRSWDVTGTMLHVNNLAEHIQRVGATSLNPNLVSSAAPGLLRVSAAHQGAIPIVNDWSNERGVFVLMLDVHYRVGAVVRWIVQGHTDEPSFTDTAIPGNLNFYINNVFALTPFQTQYGGNTVTAMALTENFQMVSGFSATHGQRPGGHVLIRPQDVMTNIANQELQGIVSNVFDTTYMAGTKPQTSRLSNNLASTMFARTVNTWNEAANGIHTSVSTGEVAEHAYGLLIERDPSMDVFMNILTAANQSLGSATLNFTFRQLLAAVPDIMQARVPMDQTSARLSFSHKGNSQHFEGQDHLTQLVMDLQAAIPTIMIESLLAGVAFRATNERGFDEFTPSGAQAFSPETDVRQLMAFQKRFELEIRPLLKHYQLRYDLTISCTFFHEIQIDLVMGSDSYTFISPAFANALFTPIQTADTVKAKNFSTQMETMAVTLNDALMYAATQRATRVEQAHQGPGSLSKQFPLPGAMGMPAAPQPQYTTGSSMGIGAHAPVSPGLSPMAAPPAAPSAPTGVPGSSMRIG